MQYTSSGATEDPEKALLEQSNPQPSGNKNKASFERPRCRRLLIHIATCTIIYPFLYFITWVAEGRSLFAVRTLVGLGTATVAFVIGFFLIDYATKFMEASTWTTLIQSTEVLSDRRMRLRELSAISSDPTSIFSAWELLKSRRRITNGTPKLNSHPMGLSYLVIFLVMIVVAANLSFTLGRMIDIVTQHTFDHSSFTELLVFGDLNEGDINAYKPITEAEEQANIVWATESTTNNRINRDVDWNNVPPEWKYMNPQYTTTVFENQTIYFTEPYAAQLKPEGLAIGSSLAGANLGQFAASTQMAGTERNTKGANTTNLLQFPQWGVRVSCEKLPDLRSNLIVNPDTTDSTEPITSAFVHLPRVFVADLYASLNLSLPEDEIAKKQPLFGDTKSVEGPNRAVMSVSARDLPFNGTIETDSSILTTVEFMFLDRELEGRLVAGYLTDYGNSGDGWTVFDVFLMRLDNNRPSNPDELPVSRNSPSTNTTYGYDGVACVQRTEPWIIEVYNGSDSVAATSVLDRSGNLDGNLGSLTSKSKRIGGQTTNSTRKLSSEGKVNAYFGAYSSSTYAWLEQTGTGIHPTQLVKYFIDLSIYWLTCLIKDVSWTNGTSPDNFTIISAQLFERFRGISAANTILPFLSGSQQVAARSFEGKQIAFAHILTIPLTITIALLGVLGIIGCVFVPSLPSGVPQRDFSAATWMTVINGDNLGLEGGIVEWKPRMEVKAVKNNFGSQPIKYLN